MRHPEETNRQEKDLKDNQKDACYKGVNSGGGGRFDALRCFFPFGKATRVGILPMMVGLLLSFFRLPVIYCLV